MKNKYKNKYEVNYLFGNWKLLNSEPIKVIKKNLQNQKNKHTLKFKCLCMLCNTEHLVDCYNLEKGISTKCYKCSMIKNSGSNNSSWKGYGEIGAKILSRARNGAIARNIKFNLSLEELDEKWKQQKQICALTGMYIDLKDASIDRIDSNGDYEYNNVQWIHKDVNIMKNHFQQDYFIKMCKSICNYQGGACEIK